MFDRTFLILHEAFKRLGYEFQLHSYPGKRSLQMSNEGLTDGEAHRIEGIDQTYNNLIRIPEVQQVIYTCAYTNRNIELPNGWSDLKRYRVAVLRGSIFATRMASKYAKQVQELSTHKQLLQFLDANRTDISIGSSVGMDDLLNSSQHYITHIRKIEPPLASLKIYAYLNRKHKELVTPLAETLRAMKYDGTYDALIERATDANETKRVPH
ncbi:substrate-binding periplasmic protein [Desulfovibrio caledoniensis]